MTGRPAEPHACIVASGPGTLAPVRVDATTGMASNHPPAATAANPHLVPPAPAAWLSVFGPCFAAPVRNHILVLLTGAVLAPGKRTVAQALQVMSAFRLRLLANPAFGNACVPQPNAGKAQNATMGLAGEPSFGRYHEVPSRARWDAPAVARRLLLHVLDRLLPGGPVAIGLMTPSHSVGARQACPNA